MTIDIYPDLPLFGEGRGGLIGHPVGRTLAASLGLHLVMLLVIMTIRLPHPVQRPSGSYQVSLVTLPVAKPAAAMTPILTETTPADPAQPAVKTTAIAPPPKPAAHATAAAIVPKAVPPAKLQPITRPLPATGKAPATSQNLVKDVLQGIELPPQAPRLTETVPAPVQQPTTSPSQMTKDIDKMISQLTIPEVRPVPSPGSTPGAGDQANMPMTRHSVLEELDRLERQLHAAQPTPPRQPHEQSKPTVTVTVPSQNTALRVEGITPGSNSYFGRVQSLISRHWAPPPVSLQSEPKVVIRFRLHRSGGVSDINVERSSGNDYYDAAGKRAILSAYPLPPFPAELSQPYVDINFTFGVDHPTG